MEAIGLTMAERLTSSCHQTHARSSQEASHVLRRTRCAFKVCHRRCAIRRFQLSFEELEIDDFRTERVELAGPSSGRRSSRYDVSRRTADAFRRTGTTNPGRAAGLGRILRRWNRASIARLPPPPLLRPNPPA